MPITFSSFGDVATVLQLAWQLRSALSDASSASAEIRALIIDIDSFTRALQQTRAAVEQRRIPLAPAIENGIKHAIIACHDALRLILRKVDAFRARITNRIGATAWRQYWAVAAWSILGGKKDVDALRVRLSEQIGVVQTYLSLAQSNDQAKVQEAVETQGAGLERIYRVMQDIQIRFDVGVPSFHFYDDSIGYYKPFSRTSFHRLKEQLDTMRVADRHLLKLDEAANRLIDASSDAILSPIVLSANVSFKQRTTLKWHPNWDGGPSFWIKLCIFRERAFNELQVLMGSPQIGRYPDIDVLKISVERSHSVGTRCRCKIGRCRTRLEACMRQANYRRPYHHAILLVDQIEHLAMHWDVEHVRAHKGTCHSLLCTISRTDRAFVQSSILPLIRLHIECQRPSLSKIEMICESEPQSADSELIHPAYTGNGVGPLWSFSPGQFRRYPVSASLTPIHPREWL